LLIMHGRKDKRVVPLMTEKIIEALEIEGKHYQVNWYDEESHGWQKRDNRRDAWKRSLDFLKRHLLEQADED
jgi:dipeptidyl aminopeptidase/acylaminoacyl peptidase